jgi:outer membrane protein
MRNLYGLLVAVTGLLALSAPLSAQAPLKIGYIDTRKVIQEAPGATEARTTLEREVAGFEVQVKAMEDSLRGMITTFQQQSLVMSADAKQKKQDEIKQKEQSYNLRMTQLQQQAQQRQQQLMEPIMKKVDDIISEVRKSEGYAIVFDVNSDAIVAADPALDITTKVLEKLKAGATATPGRQP